MKLINLLEKKIGDNKLILLDKLLGFRAWGLIPYCMLSTTLVLLGVSELKTSSFDNLSNNFLIVISIPPLLLLTMSIIHQNKKWYFTTTHLYFRSFIIILLIIFFSTSIVWISGIFNPNNLETFQNLNRQTALIKCIILAMLSLLIPSSFFLSSLASKVDIAGIPSNFFVELIKELDLKMRELIKIKNWSSYIDYDPDFMELIKEIETILNKIGNLKGNSFAKKSLSYIKYDILNLGIGMEYISVDKDCKLKNEFYWKCLFENSNDLNKEQERFRNKNILIFESIQRIKCLKV